MRVVMLSPWDERCGIATYSEALARELVAQGADVRVLAPRLAVGAPVRGEPLPRLWSRGEASVGEAWRTFRAVERLAPDRVHLQLALGLYSPRYLWVLSRALGRARIPLGVTLHERRGVSPLRRLRFARMLAALGDARLVVHNRAHAAELRGRAVSVIPHGIPTPGAADPAASKRALGLDPARPVIAHFGFIHPDKGIDRVLRAVARLEGVGYTVCGTPFTNATSRRHFAELTRLVQELGIADRVRLSGEFLGQERLELELSAADVIVLNYQTGNAQGASGAARHAFVAGRPLAVSKAPIFDDLRDSVHTLEAPLEIELRRLLSDVELRAGLTERARLRARSDSWSAVAGAHLELFRSPQASFLSA